MFQTRFPSHHAAIRPVQDHERHRPPGAERTYAIGRDFSRLPLNSAESASLRPNLTQACPFSPRRCPFGGACHSCPPRVQTFQAAGVQRKATSSDAPVEVPPIVHEVLRSPGQVLDSAIRADMEPRFNRDFSHVRVHKDDRAAESARAVDALAYTAGRDVVFGAGQYAPTTSAGRRLLAHELTHVVQQESHVYPSSHKFIQRKKGGGSTRTAPAQRLELRPSMYRSLLGGPCACLVFIHNNERNARSAAEDLHRNCRYNLAIIGPGRSRNVPVRGGNGRVDPNELFPPDIQAECTRDEAGCMAYETSHDDLRAMQIQFFLTIKACSNDFALPTVALHNNTISDTRSFLRTTSAAERERLRGDFIREAGTGIRSRQDLRSRLGRRRGIMSRSGTTNIFRWCNLPEISRCHIGDPDHPDDVIWVTNVHDFERLRQEDVNVVLQEGLDTAGGSESETDLSTLFLRLGSDARYINIETPKTPQNQATRYRNMAFIQQALDRIGLNCCEPIGDFPTPSRTEMIA